MLLRLDNIQKAAKLSYTLTTLTKPIIGAGSYSSITCTGEAIGESPVRFGCPGRVTVHNRTASIDPRQH